MVDALEQEWEVFYSDYWPTSVAGDEAGNQALQSIWNEDLATGLQGFLGDEGFNPTLGLPDDFAIQVVSQVGNYEEIYNKYGELAPLAGSVNDLWSNGGLMYVPPYR